MVPRGKIKTNSCKLQGDRFPFQRRKQHSRRAQRRKAVTPQRLTVFTRRWRGPLLGMRALQREWSPDTGAFHAV